CYRNWSSDVCSSDLQPSPRAFPKEALRGGTAPQAGGQLQFRQSGDDECGADRAPQLQVFHVHLQRLAETALRIFGGKVELQRSRSEERRVGKESEDG